MHFRPSRIVTRLASTAAAQPARSPLPIPPNIPRIGFVGAGRMASAMVGGLLARGYDPANVLVADSNSRAGDRFTASYPLVSLTDSNVRVAQDVELVVMAVKPQSLKAVMAELRPHFRPQRTLLLSIVAGATMAQLEATSGCTAVVRTMPNIAAVVGQSMTVWACNGNVTAAQRDAIHALLQTFGAVMFVQDEAFLDKSTALSGSGPGLIFLIMEAMVDAGVHLGFSREQARQLVVQTMPLLTALLLPSSSVQLGSATLANTTETHLSALRNDITSPGGTSAAGLYEAERGNLRTVVSDSVWAAYRRSLELGGNSSNVGPGRYKRD